MSQPSFSVDREIVIHAPRSTVFRYFQDSERFARWWGPGSSIEGRKGGAVRICYPNGETASGSIVTFEPQERVVFTYGYDSPGKPIPPGGSRVEVRLEEIEAGTHLTLSHQVGNAALADLHQAGWRYQLAIFATVAAAEAHAEVAARVDGYFAAWSEVEAEPRRRALEAVAVEDVQFRDGFGYTNGLDELSAHIAAAQQHLGAARLERQGEVQQCQGTALVAWQAVGADGVAKATGHNVMELAPDGRLRRVVGLWG